MRRLSDTISRLAAMRKQSGIHVAVPEDRLSAFKAFGSNPGALDAKVYIPPNLPENAPLVVVLHGCTQTAAGYDYGAGWSRLADQEGFALLFPEQRRANNPNLCFNWFQPADTKRDSGEALSIRQMVEKLTVAHGLDRDRVFVTGLSAGGAMASVLLATYPEVFAGGAIIAGLPYGSANTLPEAFDRMRGHGGPSERELWRLVRNASSHKGPWPRISVWHGSADTIVVPSNANAVVDQWRGVHGLLADAGHLERVDGHRRRVWVDPDGREMIEEHTIIGMGHGTPLASSGEAGLGYAGPFMLEHGISSTRRIAQFWGIAREAEGGRKPAGVPSQVAVPDREAAWTAPPPDPPTGSIHATIENALRAAGLMK